MIGRLSITVDVCTRTSSAFLTFFVIAVQRDVFGGESECMQYVHILFISMVRCYITRLIPVKGKSGISLAAMTFIGGSISTSGVQSVLLCVLFIGGVVEILKVMCLSHQELGF